MKNNLEARDSLCICDNRRENLKDGLGENKTILMLIGLW